jgi:hypothetical protein
MNKPRRQQAITARQQLAAMCHPIGCTLTSIGDIERLAGINTQCERERTNLWRPFVHLGEPGGADVVDAVMEHCAQRILGRLQAGELSLLPAPWAAPPLERDGRTAREQAARSVSTG